MRGWVAAFILLLVEFEAFAQAEQCGRIVSLAPSVTETLYALELGSKIEGVTRYCRYPLEAQSKTKIGGFLDPNYELILFLKPDLVVLLAEQADQERYLKQLGVTTLMLDHRSIKGIIQSLGAIGSLCGQPKRAAALAADLTARVAAVRKENEGKPPKKVLIAIGGNEYDGVLSNLFISGRDGYYDEMIKIAGGSNVYAGSTASLPSVSQEGLIALDPEVVIQIGSETDGVRVDPVEIKKAWAKLDMVRAVKEKQVYVLNDDYASIPGPRFIMLLEKINDLLHRRAA